MRGRFQTKLIGVISGWVAVLWDLELDRVILTGQKRETKTEAKQSLLKVVQQHVERRNKKSLYMLAAVKFDPNKDKR